MVGTRDLHDLVLRVLDLFQKLKRGLILDDLISFGIDDENGCPLSVCVIAGPLLLIKEETYGATLSHMLELGVIKVVGVTCHVFCIAWACGVAIAE